MLKKRFERSYTRLSTALLTDKEVWYSKENT